MNLFWHHTIPLFSWPFLTFSLLLASGDRRKALFEKCQASHTSWNSYNVQLLCTTIFRLLYVTVWGSCGRGVCERLQILQNRASRVLTFSSYERKSVEILVKPGWAGWDNLETWRTRQLAILIMYKLMNGIVPNDLNQFFTSTNSIYFYSLRNSTYNLFVPRPSTEAGKNSFHYRGTQSSLLQSLKIIYNHILIPPSSMWRATGDLRSVSAALLTNCYKNPILLCGLGL